MAGASIDKGSKDEEGKKEVVYSIAFSLSLGAAAPASWCTAGRQV